MKQFVISLFISLPLLIANSAHAEAEPCGVNFDDMSIKIGSDYLTELTQISSAGKYRLACNGTVIADCEATFNNLDQFIVISKTGELIIDEASQYPITCMPII